jgi:cysteine desulfurase
MKSPIYLDYMSTTPIDLRVRDKMLRFLTKEEIFGNPAALLHKYGVAAKDAVEKARAQVADLVNAKPEEIIWTSGATEANNLAIKGAAHFYARKGQHIITCQTEHKSVLETYKHLATEGFNLTLLKPEKNGLLDFKKITAAIREDTILVSIMQVNNEIGIIQDIQKIGELVKPHGIIFHVDAAQAAGKIPIDVTSLAVDLMSFSAHKIYGPKGIGALYIRHEPRIRIEPQMHGGGQEFGLRSGTLPVHQIVGMGEAFHLAKQEMQHNCERIKKLRDHLWNEIQTLGEVEVNGDLNQRIAHNLNVSFAKVDGKKLIAALKEIAASPSAACVSTGLIPSHVLQALGVEYNLALSSIRFSLGNFTTEEEIQIAGNYLKNLIPKLREK